MSNLQKLHDFYLTTKPNVGKVQSASNLLIRLCKHFELDSPEEITPELYVKIPKAIDNYFSKDFHKAIQDKSIFAEMIGAFGPVQGWERALEVLLNDDDSNLRQFSFQSLENIAKQNPNLIIPYIEKYKDTDDLLMQTVAARIMSKIYSPENNELFITKIKKWSEEGSFDFLKILDENIKKCIKRHESFTEEESHVSYYEKLTMILKKRENEESQ
ncbi:MAG: hypothetical protein D8M58_02720 [Calditrichaeota bacterium]|nr:MAG: hypothetical protein DWQ03_04360 [Calditrichota bacterium]MBL1204277.1 hypothetical protein [Calditrichota bacterium]NOG44107.1 hypothetical protein [Calditrichota bacterium]